MLEGQISEKRDEHSFYPDHYDTVVHKGGSWEAPLVIHCPNPISRSAADPTPASRNLAVLFHCTDGGVENKGEENIKNKNPN